MKLILTALLASLIWGQAFADEVKPELQNRMPSAVYAPYGFDNNDNVQFVLEGTFPSTCYKVGPTIVNKNMETKTITVENQVNYYSDNYCLTMLVPYKKVINLGIMDVGDFNLVFKANEKTEQLGTLNVRKANSKAADDFLYAPVDKVIYKKGELGDANTVVLRGAFTNTCMKLKEVKITRRPNSNILVVLPIAEMEERDDCAIPIVGIPFEKEINLEAYGTGRALIHVRSLNGEALNEIVDL